MRTEIDVAVDLMLVRLAKGMSADQIVKSLNEEYRHLKPKSRAKLVSAAVLEIKRRKNDEQSA
jgi:hypothetical protein